MSSKKQARLQIYCPAQDYAQWEAALAVYDVSYANSETPLPQLLQNAQEQALDLFVIVDATAESDTYLIESIQAMREHDTGLQPALRIVFVANDSREIPSYLFRVLVNLDVFDLVSARYPRNGVESVYTQVADLIFKSMSYSDAVPFFLNSIMNPHLVGLSDATKLHEKSRVQTRIAVAQIDVRRGGSTHTTFLLARVLVQLGYKVAVFVSAKTWNSMRRAYPRARHSIAAGLLTLSGVDFYRNEGFAQINGYDYVLCDFGCAQWIDINPSDRARELELNFQSAQLGVLTSVVSPFGDHSSFERVLKIWQKQAMLRNLGGVKFAFFGIPNAEVIENWRHIAQSLNSRAELYQMPYLPDPLHFQLEPGECVEEPVAESYCVSDVIPDGLPDLSALPKKTSIGKSKKHITKRSAQQQVLFDLLAPVLRTKDY